MVEAGSQITVLSRRALLPPDSGHRATAVAVDVRDFDALERAVTVARDRHRVDFVVTCVGVGFYSPIGANFASAWTEIVTTNIVGLLNLLSVIDKVLPTLSRLVCVSSMAAHHVSATPGNLCYSVTKEAARTIVREYSAGLRAARRGTRVSMISPGYVEGTGFGEHFFAYADETSTRDLYAAGVNLTAGDVAALIEGILRQPRHIEIVDILVRPIGEP
jgi:NADP-dependent 3-hydroxy acid dehydrogenase YdfG